MKILTIMARHGNEKYPEAAADLRALFAARLPDVEHALVIVDNALPLSYQGEDKGCPVWGADNTHWEFSAWDSALTRLGAEVEAFDYINLATSALFALPTDKLANITLPMLSRLRDSDVVIGQLDTFFHPLRLGEHTFQQWLRTSFLLFPPRFLKSVFPLVSLADFSAFFTEDARQPFADSAPMNEIYKHYLTAWLTSPQSGYHSRFDLNAQTLEYFQNKVRAIINEHAFSLKARLAGYELLDLLPDVAMQGMRRAPIAYICFNRPEVVDVTLKALCDAELAAESDLHIFIDGARDAEDALRVDAVKTIAMHPYVQNSFAKVTLHCLPANLGRRDTLLHVIQTMCLQGEQSIFFEDDVLCSPHALRYFNSALAKYQQDATVFSISGWRPLAMNIPEDYPWDAWFCPRCHIWGWASWRDRLASVDWAAADCVEMERHPQLVQAFNQGGPDMAPMLSSTVRAPQMGWDIVMDFSRFKQGKVSLVPTYPYTMHVGLDKSSADAVSRAAARPRLPRFITAEPRLVAEHYRAILECYSNEHSGGCEPQVKPPQEEPPVNVCLTRADGSIFSASVAGLDLHEQVGAYYGRHRSGWAYVTEGLRGLHNPSAPYFETFVERRFSWGAWMGQKFEPLRKPWIGVVHVPLHIPPWFGQSNVFTELSKTPQWQSCAPYCRGLFTLSHSLLESLQNLPELQHLPMDVLFHPTEFGASLWSAERWQASQAPALVQVGSTYRNLHAIHCVPPGPYRKLLATGGSEASFRSLYTQEEDFLLAQGRYSLGADAGTTLLGFLDDAAYDALFTESVLFAEYYAASATNLVLECIARHTPLLVNPLPAIVEYLGKDYPLYFASYQEAGEKAACAEVILEAHHYLEAMDKTPFTREYFVERLLHSPVYAAAFG